MGQKGGGFGSEFPDEHPPGGAAASNPDDDKPLNERLVAAKWNTKASAFDELKGIIAKYGDNTDNDVMQ